MHKSISEKPGKKKKGAAHGRKKSASLDFLSLQRPDTLGKRGGEKKNPDQQRSGDFFYGRGPSKTIEKGRGSCSQILHLLCGGGGDS